jgi:phage terminase large subunit
LKYTDIKIDFTELQNKAMDLLSSPGVEILGFGGAKGGGKSHFIRTRQVLRRLKYAKTEGLIVRKTLVELERNHIRKIQKEWPDLAYDYKDQKHQFRLKNGSVLDLAYIDTEDDLDRLQGIEYDDIDIDEAEHHPKIVFSTLRSCLRTTNKVIKPTMILGFNWGNIGHAWLKRMFWRKGMIKNRPEEISVEEWKAICEEDTWDNPIHWDRDEKTGYGERPDQFAFLQVFWYDNPHLDQGYKDRLAALPESLRKAFMDGDPDVFEGQFFPEFGPQLREKPFYIPMNEANLYGSLDYGEGSGDNGDPTSFGLWHIDRSGKPHRLFTYYKRGLTASSYAREIVAAIQSFPYTYGAMPKMTIAGRDCFITRKMDENSTSVAKVFEQHGLTLTPANTERVNGWRITREYFGRDSVTKENKSAYFDGYNDEYELYIPTLVYAKTNKSDVKKGGEDHVGDETRYFFVFAMGDRTKMYLSNQKEKSKQAVPITSLVSTLRPIFFSSRKVKA